MKVCCIWTRTALPTKPPTSGSLMVMSAPSSRRQYLIQLANNLREALAEQLRRLPASAFLHERNVIESIKVDFQALGDVVAHQGQPMEMLVAELAAGGVLLGQLVFEALVHLFRISERGRSA